MITQYKTLAAYYCDGDVIFGLTNQDIGNGALNNASGIGIKSLDHALRVDEWNLRKSIVRALVDAVHNSRNSLAQDMRPESSANSSYESTLLQVFSDRQYRPTIFTERPETIELPQEKNPLIENLTPRLEGLLRLAYIKMAQELSPPLAVPAT